MAASAAAGGAYDDECRYSDSQRRRACGRHCAWRHDFAGAAILFRRPRPSAQVQRRFRFLARRHSRNALPCCFRHGFDYRDVYFHAHGECIFARPRAARAPPVTFEIAFILPPARYLHALHMRAGIFSRSFWRHRPIISIARTISLVMRFQEAQGLSITLCEIVGDFTSHTGDNAPHQAGDARAFCRRAIGRGPA